MAENGWFGCGELGLVFGCHFQRVLNEKFWLWTLLFTKGFVLNLSDKIKSWDGCHFLGEAKAKQLAHGFGSSEMGKALLARPWDTFGSTHRHGG